ncbi:MAG: DUF5000 domain-containing lipoprotein [Rikenellaceae bacterium]
MKKLFKTAVALAAIALVLPVATASAQELIPKKGMRVYTTSPDTDNTDKIYDAKVFPGDYSCLEQAKAWSSARLFDNNPQSALKGRPSYAWCSVMDDNYTTAKKPNYGVTIELSPDGKAYKLSKFQIWIPFASKFSGQSVKTFSVYGTTDPDPINNKGLTLLNEDSTPYLENWTLLLDNVEVYKPTKAKKDVNGDGKVDEEDDLQIFTDGWSYDIKGDFPAMRYIKVVMHTNWANKPTGFRMQEISVYHNGVGETKAVKAKVPKKFKSPKWSETL